MPSLTAPVSRSRIESIDLLRGVIMIVMALDHVRDFLGSQAISPTDLSATTVPLFFTRWVTHFCAPVFFFVMGTGAYLAGRNRNTRQLSWFLFTRGVWLIFLEAVVTRCLGWQFNFDYRFTALIILWALGWALITLAGLVYLPVSVVTAFGVILILGHNLLDGIQSANPLWTVLHSPNLVIDSPRFSVLVGYALIPWVGVTAAGYGLGQIYLWEAKRRRVFLLRMGILLTAAFVVLRAINRYGDPQPWSVQHSAAFTALSFLNTTKYPPSLLFLLMTLGPATLFLWKFDGGTPSRLRPALIFGKVPMFYYLLHIPLIHIIAIIVCYLRYGHIYRMFQSPARDRFPITPPPGWGVSLPMVYLFWGVVVVLLYPACRWYAAVKQRSKSAWLSYF